MPPLFGSTTPASDWIVNSHGLVGFWPGGARSGAAYRDLSAAGNNGTPGTAVSVAGGMVAAEYQSVPFFNGTTGQQAISPGVAGEVGDVFTLSCVVKVASGYGGYGGLLSKPTNGYQFQFYGGSAGLIRLLKTNVTDMARSTKTINDNRYHAVMATKDGATVKIYIDGVDRTGTVTNATIANTGGNLWLGCDASGSSAALTGSAGLFAIWNRALTAYEASTHAALVLGSLR